MCCAFHASQYKVNILPSGKIQVLEYMFPGADKQIVPHPITVNLQTLPLYFEVRETAANRVPEEACVGKGGVARSDTSGWPFAFADRGCFVVDAPSRRRRLVKRKL